MPIPTPNPESSTTRPDLNQAMPDPEGASLVDSRGPLTYFFRFTDNALGTPECEQDIISGGNLVLIVAAGGKRFRITVQAVRVCSCVLADILDQHNITGADNMGRVYELRLPNDDVTAARNAFGSIYPGNPHTDNLLPAEIYDVVMFARKYEMIPEFRKVAPNWFRPRLRDGNFHPVHRFFGLEECWYLMVAAHYMYLDDPDGLPDIRFAFFKLGERLVTDENLYYNARLREPVPHGHSVEADIYRKAFFLIQNA
ncbi:hypothetical protein FGADI_798 [Fusarium gaditjirri]|uniref:Uncharacterized protein n=1 Tax=Fusarium gaditjirri TaxID=282569 RepID=A0A8H4TMI7_9HYPO|nr:hypothetical protein FGADI_798 [Fusarium gaditjirri]